MVFNKKKGMMVKSNMKNEASSMGMKKNIFAVKREEDDDDDFEETNISMDYDDNADNEDDKDDDEDETEDTPTPGQKIQPQNNPSKKSAMANNKQVVKSAQNNNVQGKKNQAVLGNQNSNGALQGKKVVKGPSALIAQQDNDEDEEVDEEEGKKAIQKNFFSLKQDVPSKLPKNKKKNEGLTQDTPEDIKYSIGVLSEELLKKELERSNELESRRLYMNGFAEGTTADEIKTLSSDILNVSFSRSRRFCFLHFETEEKAVKNHKQLQGKKLNGREFFMDIFGAKSKKAQNGGPIEVVKNKLLCEGIPEGTSVEDVAKLFPKASLVTASSLFDYRAAYAIFHRDEDAAEAFEANENAKIRGKSVVVVYPYATEKMKRKRKSFPSRGGPAGKRQRC